MRRPLAIGLLALALGGCGASLRPFPLRAPLWEDTDRRPFGPAPDEREVASYWDAIDHMLFRPLSETWLLELDRPAIDVNALDEVPSSSWFTNRIGRTAVSADELARGACAELDPVAPAPWIVTGGKPGGASPGFTIEDAAGGRYLLKTDRVGHPEQSSAADAIVAALFHAAGYYVPCNRVAFFDPSELVLGEGAEARGATGRRRPMTQDDLARVVEVATRAPDGRRRVLLSRFVEGRPLGPWDYVGTWDRDPNDVVPHQHRRELRGSYVFYAWVDHWDARQENTLASWIETAPDAGYVRHYLLDFGESIGLSQGNHRQGARFGHTAFLDPADIFVDVVSLGILRRPWDDRVAHPVLGYFDAEHFDPERWHPHYWNGAMDQRTEADLAWGARILARFTDAHVAAAVRLGRYSDPAVARRATETLVRRRDALLERYLTRLSPLGDPRVIDGRTVCATDLAVHAGIRASASRRYTAVLHREGASPSPRAVSADGERVCVELAGVDGSGRRQDYLVLDLSAATPGRDRSAAARLHLYATGPGEVTLVGLER